MLTYLPYPDFTLSVAVMDDETLDDSRRTALGTVEHLLIWRELQDPNYKMWTGYEVALFHYLLAAVAELRKRGYEDDTVQRCGAIMVEGELGTYVPRAQSGDNLIVAVPGRVDPPWLGWDELHESHQSVLLRRKPEKYEQLWPHVPDDLPLVWP